MEIPVAPACPRMDMPAATPRMTRKTLCGSRSLDAAHVPRNPMARTDMRATTIVAIESLLPCPGFARCVRSLRQDALKSGEHRVKDWSGAAAGLRARVWGVGRRVALRQPAQEGGGEGEEDRDPQHVLEGRLEGARGEGGVEPEALGEH